MASDATAHDGPDLTSGVHADDFDERGMLRGHVGEEPVLLVRQRKDVWAIDATCTHYGGPLEEGLVVGDTVRCPWHHACFSLRTGQALGAPALEPVGAWAVEQDGDRIIVRERSGDAAEPAAPAERRSGGGGQQGKDVLIVGGGGAGFACAQMLRRNGHRGRITIFSSDRDAPYDRPKLSKQFLAGAAGADDLPLASERYFADSDIDLRLDTEVTSIDLPARTVSDESGRTHGYDVLVSATGAEPVQLPIRGTEHRHVHTLRTVSDSAAILAAAKDSRHAVILGSGFIGLEVAASLSEHEVEVHVVTQDDLPLEKVLGKPLAQRVQREHERHGTHFHTGTSISRIETDTVTLDDGTRIDADLVVLGVGVTPRTELAESAGLEVDDGVLVDECLRTGSPGIYAAGDIARWRDAGTGLSMRVEHWVLAQRQGQHVARNILHGDTAFTDVPFFWSTHHDMSIRYVGHAQGWDELDIDGDIDELDCIVRYRTQGTTRAVATVGRDLAALEWEAEHEGPSVPD